MRFSSPSGLELAQEIAQVRVPHRSTVGATIPAKAAAPIQWL
jgi:hypothetical protein